MRESDISASATTDPLEQRLAARLAALRTARGWSLDDLAAASGISRATLSRLERGDTSPTATLLGKLCAAHNITMSRLIAEVEQAPTQYIARAAQTVWTDPETGFERRIVSGPARDFQAELVEGTLPAGAVIDYPQPPVVGLEHHLWLISGLLDLTIDGLTHRLSPGDCLRFHLTTGNRFSCPGPLPAHYLIVLCEP